MELTRTFKRFSVKVIDFNDNGEVVTVFDGVTVAPHMTTTQARALAGYKGRTGKVIIREISEVKYSCTIEDFLSVAHEVTD